MQDVDESGSTEVQSPHNAEHHDVGGWYPKYVLGVLFIVYIFNFIDRQILSILAEEIKADLGISDAQMGFLFGTAFAVFYALFGIPLGKLADVWNRKSLISIGLLFWSVMTALSGTARGFLALGTYRMGVGVGEASASPSAYSMLGDYFPPRMRATAMAIYSSGVYVGSGIGMFLGAWIVNAWNTAYAESDAPFGLSGWHVAFFVVGIPGIFMAAWVWTLREPVRGSSEGIVSAEKHPHPFREFFNQLAAVVPPFTVLSLVREGASRKILLINIIGAGIIALTAWGLISWLGESARAQWIALGIGIYATLSWIQNLSIRDRVTFTMIFRSHALLFGIIGFACCTFITYGLGFWFSPYYIREHGQDIVTVGRNFGLAGAIGGFVGVSSGGFLSDWLKTKTPRARPYVGIISIVLTVPIAIWQITTNDSTLGYKLAYIVNAVSSIWLGSGVALANELVLPRMRATASAFYLLMITFIGLALGPYTIGQISTALNESGMDSGEALQRGMLYSLLVYIPAALCFVISAVYIKGDESTRLERAKSAGETGL
ncbi:MAG TPA: MFS transporter [Candidatus Hydrogenedentes bacterium]|nr:MFS transporter [Candidatus Hydrogenedentota bacterium]